MGRWVSRLMALAAVVLAAGSARAETEVKFVLDWALQGNHAIWTIALEKGYFAREGLKVTMDRGFGSGDSLLKVASGAYDIGFCDVNNIVKFNAETPSKPMISVMQLFDNLLASVITLKSKNIKTPQDLVGKTLASPDGEGSRLLFPAFARANKIDAASIKWISVTPQMRETLLVQGQTDAIAGFSSTAIFNIKAAGVKPDDIVVMGYPDYGVELYGNGLNTTAAYAEKNPQVIAAFIRATIAGWRDMVRDPKAAIATLKKRDNLLNEEVEYERLQYVLDKALLTPAIKARDIGDVVPERMTKAVTTIAEAFQVANPPKPETIYTTKFLPPQSERLP
ncbi:MAG: ABC transporter substrate-binding protein [Alphaproteobacteria bacterium]|nr:ABC transporter substrate-binding protein [Alphaproteobacteria bacterium]